MTANVQQLTIQPLRRRLEQSDAHKIVRSEKQARQGTVGTYARTNAAP